MRVLLLVDFVADDTPNSRTTNGTCGTPTRQYSTANRTNTGPDGCISFLSTHTAACPKTEKHSGSKHV